MFTLIPITIDIIDLYIQGMCLSIYLNIGVLFRCFGSVINSKYYLCDAPQLEMFVTLVSLFYLTYHLLLMWI